MSKNIVLNKELFEKIFKENNGKCLHKTNTKCPCYEFIEHNECECGVFKNE